MMDAERKVKIVFAEKGKSLSDIVKQILISKAR